MTPTNRAALALVCLTSLVGGGAQATDHEASVEVTVIDRDGQPVPEVAVYAVPRIRDAGRDVAHERRAKVDQRDRAFVPHILVVETGTEITFPNSDEILHHVYSFSPTKRFQLSLAAGSTQESLRFDEPGLVTLGCNIHDSMLGYVLVVDTPHFSLTDGRGRARLDELPQGDYTLEIWTPRLRPNRLPQPIALAIADGGAAPVSIQIIDKLYPPHADSETSLVWDVY